MTISYQFGDVDAHGALIRSQAASLEAEHQNIVRDVLAAGDFWGGAGSVACQEFITQLGRNFQVIYEQANAHGLEGAKRRQQHGQHRQRRRLQLGLIAPGNGGGYCEPIRGMTLATCNAIRRLRGAYVKFQSFRNSAIARPRPMSR